jgi:hypothetical protein
VQRCCLCCDGGGQCGCCALLPAKQPQDELWDNFFRELAGTEDVVAARDQDGQVVGADVGFGDEFRRRLAAGVGVCGFHDGGLRGILPQYISVNLQARMSARHEPGKASAGSRMRQKRVRPRLC